MILSYYISKKEKKMYFPYSEQVIVQKHEDKIPPPG